jgi:hypothetical protein
MSAFGNMIPSFAQNSTDRLNRELDEIDNHLSARSPGSSSSTLVRLRGWTGNGTESHVDRFGEVGNGKVGR